MGGWADGGGFSVKTERVGTHSRTITGDSLRRKKRRKKRKIGKTQREREREDVKSLKRLESRAAPATGRLLAVAEMMGFNAISNKWRKQLQNKQESVFVFFFFSVFKEKNKNRTRW